MKDRDDILWEKAKERVGFKYHLAAYILVNIFLWGVWYMTGEGYMWPVWPTLGWAVGLGFHYVQAYVADEKTAVQREFDKLKAEEEASKNS